MMMRTSEGADKQRAWGKCQVRRQVVWTVASQERSTVTRGNPEHSGPVGMNGTRHLPLPTWSNHNANSHKPVQVEHMYMYTSRNRQTCTQRIADVKRKAPTRGLLVQRNERNFMLKSSQTASQKTCTCGPASCPA